MQEYRDWGRAGTALERQIDVDRAWIGEAAHAAHRSEVFIEGVILLHQNDDVLNVANRARAVVRWNSECLGNVRAQRARHGPHAHQLQELTTIGILHGMTPLPKTSRPR